MNSEALMAEQADQRCARCRGLGSLPASSRVRPGPRKVVAGYICPECAGSGRKAA